MWCNMLIFLPFLVTFSFWWLHCLFPELYCFNLHIELSPTHLHLNIRLQTYSHLIKSKEYVLCLTLKLTGLLVWALLTWVKIAGSDLHSSISLVRITHVRNAGSIFPSLIHIHVSWTLFSDLRIRVIVLLEIPVQGLHRSPCFNHPVSLESYAITRCGLEETLVLAIQLNLSVSPSPIILGVRNGTLGIGHCKQLTFNKIVTSCKLR